MVTFINLYFSCLISNATACWIHWMKSWVGPRSNPVVRTRIPAPSWRQSSYSSHFTASAITTNILYEMGTYQSTYHTAHSALSEGWPTRGSQCTEYQTQRRRTQVPLWFVLSSQQTVLPHVRIGSQVEWHLWIKVNFNKQKTCTYW
jgi:hypothetical protein